MKDKRSDHDAVKSLSFDLRRKQQPVDRFPKLNLVSFGVHYLSEFPILMLLIPANDGDPFLLELFQECFEIFNPIVEHELLRTRIEMFSRLRKRTPRRSTRLARTLQ